MLIRNDVNMILILNLKLKKGEKLRKKLFTIAVIVATLVSMVMVTPALASQPKPWTDGIPVDIDPYYKSLGKEATKAIIEKDTAEASAILETQKADTAKAEVGDVEWLYADGWREFTLRAIGDNAEIWVANDLNYCEGDPRPAHTVTDAQVNTLFDEFNSNIYPNNTNYFGLTNDRNGTGGLFTSWGYDWYVTDNPQRVMILCYNIIDEGYCDPEYPFYVAGFFWATMNDVYADRNVIHIDTYKWEDRIGPDVGRPYLYEGVIAHEYEHAIHYDHDADEPSWVDEGMADLAGYLCGYGHSSGHIAYYMVYHRWPLTNWLGSLQDYGQSYLFQLYLMENFSKAKPFASYLVDEQANGIEGIGNVLTSLEYTTTFDDIYHDWVLANYLDDISLIGNSGAKLGYDNLDIPSDDTWGYSIDWSIKNNYKSGNKGNLPVQRYWGGYKSATVEWPVRNIPAYAPVYQTYKGIQPELDANFRGDNTTGIPAHGGDYEWYGGNADLLFNTLTLANPITLGAGANLSFWTNYQIETAWDFGFVQISTDSGGTWTSLANAHTTSDYDPAAHPDVIANVPGFTGSSGGWVEETFDLSAYAGESALIRFLFVTDWAYTETGWYIDDVTIYIDDATIGFSDDMEAGPGNWTSDGWSYTTGLAINDWALTIIDPNFEKGKFSNLDIVDVEITLVGDYQIGNAVVDTLDLGKDKVTSIIWNRLPEEISFDAKYLYLVEKGDARD